MRGRRNCVGKRNNFGIFSNVELGTFAGLVIDPITELETRSIFYACRGGTRPRYDTADIGKFLARPCRCSIHHPFPNFGIIKDARVVRRRVVRVGRINGDHIRHHFLLRGCLHQLLLSILNHGSIDGRRRRFLGRADRLFFFLKPSKLSSISANDRKLIEKEKYYGNKREKYYQTRQRFRGWNGEIKGFVSRTNFQENLY